ncbi:MAG: hypothetical protein V4511_02565 [Bacteroidota bacterium]
MKNRLLLLTQKIVVFLLISTLIISCSQSSKLMKSGNYDAAIRKSSQKLKRKKQNDKEIVVLEQSYQKANDRDRERIGFLKKEGKPDNWDEIFAVYSMLAQRQENLKPLLPLRIAGQNRDANFEIVNYSDEIIQAKKNATEYFYAHALSLLGRNNKSDARLAYNELLRVKGYSGNYKDVDKELQRAKDIGTSYVLFKMKNTTGVPLPPSFEDELTKISLTDLNGEWLRYYTHEVKGLDYDYVIVVNMKNINVSPEAIKETNFTETKIIPDGFQYALDANGNVKKDSLGNDIKLPKTKTIFCNVIETYQNKKAIIAGSLDYINNSTGQLIKTDPIASENFFEYRSFGAIGDINALKPETKAKLGPKPVPFPSGFDMLLQAGQVLKGMTKDIIYKNKSVLF